jgi:hypothetical protein
MEYIKPEELEIDEEKYQLWKTELNEKRQNKKQSSSNLPKQIKSPPQPKQFIEEAARMRRQALSIIHVEADTTTEMFQRIDELLEAS